MSRPTINSILVIQKAAEQLLPKINEWGEDSFRLDDLLKILKDSFSDNGYQLAKDFEDLGCEPDLELVEILDSVIFIKLQCQKELIKEWVINNNISSTKKEGDIVTIKHNRKNITGEIVRVDSELAQYLVCCQSEGHVKTGLGKQGFVINCEDIIEPL